MIRPTVVTDAILIGSSVSETDYSAWNSGTAYVVGNRCILASTHRIYECLVNNTNYQPDLNRSGVTPKWLDIAPTNQHAMFDSGVSTQTSATETITVVLAPGRANALALLNIDVQTARIVMVSSAAGAVVYDQTYDLSQPGSSDWYSYFFGPRARLTDFVVTDLPLYAACQITVTLTVPSGTVKCGVLVVGSLSELGETEYDPGIGITDYSRKTVDDFGNTNITERAYAKRMDLKMVLDKNNVDAVVTLLASYRATAVVWIGSGNLYTSLIVYGYFRSFTVDIPYHDLSYCTLEIEGLK
jgi:hypothetical protein